MDLYKFYTEDWIERRYPGQEEDETRRKIGGMWSRVNSSRVVMDGLGSAEGSGVT